MNTIWQDLRYGARMLRRRPGFTLVAVLTLALGIGANTALFSLVDRLLVQTLPVDDPASLVELQAESLNPPLTFRDFSWADFREYRARNQVLTDLTAFQKVPVSLGEGDQLERVRAELVAENYFAVLGVQPVLGRAFLPAENRTPGAVAVAMLSYSLWQSRFGGDPQVTGQTVLINERPFTIIGVAPAGFAGVELEAPTDLWAPAMMAAEVQQRKPKDDWLADHRIAQWQLIGRLRPGLTQSAAGAALDTIAQQVRDEWMPAGDRQLPFNEKRLQLAAAARGISSLRGEYGRPLQLLFGIVGIILLIACANVASLMMVRASARRREIAVRLALGAGRWRLLRQLLTESLLLAGLGGAAGLLLAPWLTDLLLSWQTRVENPALVFGPVLNWRVGIFTLGLTLLAGLLAGLLPALQSARPDLIPALQEEGAGATDGQGFALPRRMLIVAQVALAVVVLIAAGLLLRSLNNLFTVDPGFAADGVLVARIELPRSQYPEERTGPFFEQLREQLQALPGVQAVSMAEYTPLGGTIGLNTVVIAGQPATEVDMPTVDVNRVGAGYHELMGIALRQGRGFTAQDRADQPGVVIVNEAFARKFFQDQNALGQRISLGTGMPWLQIVGIAGNVKSFRLDVDERPQIDLPLAQQEARYTQRVLIRGDNVAALLPLVRQTVRGLDRRLAFFRTTTLQGDLRTTMAIWRMAATLSSMFGLVALFLAAIGLHGSIAFSVGQRTREIGIRMALGAQKGDVYRLILREGLVLTAAGLTLGLLGAFVATRLIESLLFGVSATDPLTFTLIALLLLVVAMFACYAPARRATKVDPMVALRYE